MIVTDKEALFRRLSLVCDGCGDKETKEGFESEMELIEFHSYPEAAKRGRLPWLFDGHKHWCPNCRVGGRW